VWRREVLYTIKDLSEEDATSKFFDPKMDLEVPPETSVFINDITEHDIAKTENPIEQKPV